MKTKLGQFLLIAVIGLVGVLSASAQTNLAPPSKNLLIGDWVSVVDPKDKIKFTADEFIFFKLAVDGKYTLLSNDEVEIDIGGKKGKFKATVEGDVLTIIAGNATDKYKRESSGSTVNKAQPIKNELIGTWANSSSRRERATFTADEVTFYSFVDDLERETGPSRGEPTDKIFKYTYVSNDEIELTSDGKISRMKIILEGEMLAMINDKGVKVRYTRNLMGGATITSPLAPTDSSNPQTFKNSIGMEFVKIPAGSFLMGSPTSEKNRRPDEGPQRQVTLSKDFYMGTTEVTQEQYEKVMGSNPSPFEGCPKCPVDQVSWEDAQKFIKKLNAKNEGVYRLPSEAEWEYAARAGTTGDYAGDLDSMAWYLSNSGSKTNPVATKKSNAFGLYDMHGNVWEWVEDIYNEKGYGGLPTDGSANVTIGNASYRVLRGGSWYDFAYLTRSANRSRGAPSARGSLVGFRVLARPK